VTGTRSGAELPLPGDYGTVPPGADEEHRRALLAIDLGLHTGLALYRGDGRLAWYRSQHFRSAAGLRRAARALLASIAGLHTVVVEGGGRLADLWEREGRRRGVHVRRVSAETWRLQLLLSREQRTGTAAKQHAGELARRVIAWSDAARPTALRHDAAEAILVGLWAALDLGWLPQLPDAVRRR
jgi:hypothetical protein